MTNITEIKQLPKAEKLRLMEAIWDDLLQEDEPLDSPEWHGSALRETEECFAMGKEEMIEWHEAKKILQKQAK